MAIEINSSLYEPYSDRMHKSLEVLQDDLNTVRAGRANPRVLDQISVIYYGMETPLSQVASISTPEARQLLIQPWDGKLLKDIEKALMASDIGITPTNDGKVIRLIFPTLTEERRRDLTKQVDKYGEETKVAIRNIRRDFLDMVKKLLKNKEISEDQFHDCEDEIQKITDKFTGMVDDKIKDKGKELMAI